MNQRALAGDYHHDILLCLEHRDAKRRRLDEDVKSHMVATYGRAKQGWSTQAVVTAPTCTVSRWSAELLCGYMHAAYKHFSEHCESISLVLDASRFGQPREETLAFAIWDCKGAKATWLPVQAQPE